MPSCRIRYEMTLLMIYSANQDGKLMTTKARPCIICGKPSADNCDEMICGYLCRWHLSKWSPWGGHIQQAWEDFCRNPNQHNELPLKEAPIA